MTKHTYFRADDGTVFLPEPIDTIALMHCNNAMAYEACLKHDLKTSTNIILSRRIYDCGFSCRALNILRWTLYVETVQDLCNLRKTDLLKCRGAGHKTFAEVDNFMTSNNLKWKEV